MVNVSGGNRSRYLEKIKPFRLAIKDLLEREQTARKIILGRDISPEAAALKRFDLAGELLNLTSNHIILSSLSQFTLGTKNTEALDEGRKALYKSAGVLEEITGRQVDAPFSDYEERLALIKDLGAQERYFLIRKMGLTLRLLENAYGDNTRWKWPLVELEGRFAAAAKNILDLKALFRNTDPRSPEYEPTVRHLRLVKKLLMQAADRYRDRYELSTRTIDDFKTGILFLTALRRLHILCGEREQAELLKKRLDSWAAKLEGDLKNTDKLTHSP